MTIEELRQTTENRLSGSGFTVSMVSNAGGYDRNDLFKISRDGWENEKYDFHYEVQYGNKKSAFELRIDCHFNPYKPFKEDTHGREERYKLVEILKRIAGETQNVMPSIRRESAFCDDSLWGVKWMLSNEVCFEQLICIVFETYKSVDEIVIDNK